MSRRKTAILISGRGSNMDALIKAAAAPNYGAEIALVMSNNPDAAGLETAAAHGIRTITINHRDFETREDFDAALSGALESAGIELICLAGFMRLFSDGFVETWYNRIINIHPSLLPSYKGLDTHTRVLRDCIRITGCTVHYVRGAMDTGPQILQAAVPVVNGDTPDTLGARVLEAEHVIYPRALDLVAKGLVRVAGEEAQFSLDDHPQAPLVSPAPEV
ncbi:MAG: phosphoribosylglycinamide formyltransferase [Hyphomicrobiales bacterium]